MSECGKVTSRGQQATGELRANVVHVTIDTLKVRTKNPRTHSVKQILQIAASIKRFGFVNPILIDADQRIIAGHGRLTSAQGKQRVATPIARRKPAKRVMDFARGVVGPEKLAPRACCRVPTEREIRRYLRTYPLVWLPSLARSQHPAKQARLGDNW
jgi:hypothetical protein